ncbi:MarR family winged helix-turn-helix transcriptional regulator [Desulfitobacterium chlororespirans]|uniref:DNA-binding transcriptional regulator, MarR family n=1 Tax=Desulfitobacterium chlororespirans DSM 11544 TaxID=1121395 RepID=A0A1M7TVY3_9FIRM|nr:MarR family winged helix-turn-helix transcriptional regulator [Desulfitobacterium chlororespirans]SHN74840.1 DNA-binding transcriptional regulator, MarR family [Desulfitobacterium chlororespirans DSM 11544]
MKFIEVDKRKRYYGTDVPIYIAEIHMLGAIAEHEGIHMASLAEHMGVTKGFVSEIMAKLKKKGLVIKERDSHNQTKIILKLTEKGKLANENHLKFHRMIDEAIIELLSDQEEGKISFLEEFSDGFTRKMASIDAEI